MGVIHHKTWFDLWENRSRTIQVVLIIAIGAFAIGTTMGGAELIRRDITRVWQGTHPPVIGLEVDPPVDDTMLDTLAHMTGVATAEGRMEERIKWRLQPGDEWQSADLSAREDYDAQKLSTLTLDSGSWPQRKQMAVERGYDLGLGDRLYLEIGEKEYVIELGGVVYNPMVAPVSFGGSPTFYTTRERFGQLTGEKNFDKILATIPTYDPDEAVLVADRMQNQLKKQDIKVYPGLPNDDRTTAPDKHFIQNDVDSVFFILTVLAVFSLILGLFLVYNTITAIVSQQVSQIGMMKAIGATFGQILRVYFSQVLIYALLALLIAVPLGVLGAQGLRIFLIGLFNMEPGPVAVLPNVIGVQAVVALLSPLVVAVIPILTGARITVREAISAYGLGGTSGLIDRLMVKARLIPRSLALTIGNTFRNKSRVFVTQLTLVGSGLVFMMVMNAQASLVFTFSDVLFSMYDTNVFLDLEDKARIETIETLTMTHPEVKAVEMWGFASGTIRPAGRPESHDDRTAYLDGIPLPTTTFRPQMRAGRWLRPDDHYAIVMHQKLAQKAGVGVGDWITLNMPLKRESKWQVVGLLFSPFDENSAYVPRDILLKETGQVGRARDVRIQTIHQDAASEARVAGELRTLYEANGYKIAPSDRDTAHRLTEDIMSGGISIVIKLLAAMAIITAAVGAVALSGVISINVLERRREIGVMRAIGASSLHIFKLFIGEGLLLGWLSWLIAWPLSLPAGTLLVGTLAALMETELTYDYSVAGALYWLGIITVLAIIASVAPAWGATRISVRESLAYQ